MKNCDEIVHHLLERREEYMKQKKERKKRSLVICSAVLCIFTVTFLLRFNFLGIDDSINQPADRDTSINIVSNSEQSNGKKSTTNQLDDKENEKNTDDGKQDNETEEKKYRIYTESVMLPEDTGDDVQYDMIGCLYYKGSVYTEAESYWGDEVKEVKKILDKKIGEAKGTLNEWSTQEEWSTELASTYSGPVYTVKGYKENFRLSIYSTVGDEEYLTILENYDRIGLNTGSDLFEERLHLDGNIKKITYQTHEDWNEGRDEIRDFDKITEEEWNKFIKKLYQSPFEKIDHQKDGDFYDRKLQGHLYLQMKDGTKVEMRLIDGGYVGSQSLGWYYVKMPGELFDKVMEACQK